MISARTEPERGPIGVTKTPWHERIAAVAGRGVGRIRSSTFGAWLLDLLLALRPVWWVLRGRYQDVEAGDFAATFAPQPTPTPTPTPAP